MTVLCIFREEDVSQSHELLRFQDGSYYIGREIPINCNNKRISRKHARIVVHRNGALIISVHANPTFFKSCIGNTIQILKKDDKLVLNNGDRFALLEDNVWFKIKIIYEEYDYSGSVDIYFNAISNKRQSTEYNEANKRIKIEPEQITDAIIDNSSPVNLLPSNHGIHSEALNSEISTLNMNVAIAMNNSDLHCDKKVPNNCKVNTDTSHSSDSLPINPNVNGEDLDLNDTLPIIREESIETLTSVNVGNNNLENVKIEPLEHAEREEPLNNELNAVTLTSGSNLQIKIKIEPGTKVQTEINQNKPSSSTTSTTGDSNNLRRDRCWYGQHCYRKNPIHKQDFSHPSDTDYDSDPNDVRPVCPFGVHCYRRNILHRREFKHFGRPAPRPTTVNINVNTSCSHGQHPPRKPDYESDCESENET